MQFRHLTYIITLLLSALGCAAAEPTDSASVWFLTCAEGSDIYELEGHTALRIADPRTGTDCVVNWGLFDFSAPFFVYRFVKGETDYKSGVAPTELFLMQYAGSGREVTAQRLNLTAAETDTLITLISDCLRPENRTYRYNYVYDNCSTRALAYVERALGDSIALAAPQLPENTDTFRKVMAYYHRNYPWYQFGIDLALGSGIDHKLTRREYAFAPVVLRGMLSGATAGARKVVTSEEKIIDTAGRSAVLPPTPWYATPMAFAVVILALSALFSVCDIRRRHLTRWFDTVLFSAQGLSGCLIAFLVFVSVHEATSPNWVILWLNPLCLLGAVLPWVKKAENLLLWYHFFNFASLIVLTGIFAFGLQSANAAFYPLILADILRSSANIYVIKWSKSRK